MNIEQASWMKEKKNDQGQRIWHLKFQRNGELIQDSFGLESYTELQILTKDY